jgi:hypothetical protein
MWATIHTKEKLQAAGIYHGSLIRLNRQSRKSNKECIGNAQWQTALTQPGPLLNGSINFPDFFGLLFFLSLDEKFKISEEFIEPFQRYSLL